MLGIRRPASRLTEFFTTGSLWFGGVAMAASLVMLAALRERDGIGRIISSGERLQAGLREQAALHGLSARLSGHRKCRYSFLTPVDDERSRTQQRLGWRMRREWCLFASAP